MTAARTLPLLAFAALLHPLLPARAPAQPPADPFEAGRQMIEYGDVASALALWLAARDSLEEEGEQDARIATAFISHVAASGLERYEEMATSIFYWGFSGMAPERARDEIRAEGLRTFTLVDSAAAQYWDRVGREDPGALALAVKLFWIERDPTPATPVNERLVEHWRRVDHARRNFVYNRSSPYGTDDRGTFHVKYGRPDRISRGHLQVSEAERRERGIPEDYIYRFDQQPQYEIWRYAHLHPGDWTYFLFGNTEGTGPFRHVQGLHEIIPLSARTSGVARHQGIRAQHYLELFYYEDMATMGGPFGLRFGELMRLWGSARPPTEGSLEAVSLRHRFDDQEAARQPRPAAISDLDDIPRSALSAQAARVLEEGEPRLLVMAVSSPIWLPNVESGDFGERLALASYTASHTVIARDGGLHEMARAGMLPVDGPGHLSTLVLRHQPAIRHLTVSARHDVHDDGAAGDSAASNPPRRRGGAPSDRDSAAPDRLPGQVHFAVDEPLRPVGAGRAVPGAAAAVFEVSDLVVGIAPRPEVDLGALPVPLLPATQFWRDDPLRIYFEVYRADPVAGGDLDLRVHLVPVDASTPGVPLPEAEDLDLETAAIALSLESPSTRDPHFFDLDLRNERAGLLRIVVEIRDGATGAERLRVVPVRLLEY